jgi:molecular chaperone DnaJ
MKKILNKDLYSILGVKRDSDIDKIKKSYYKLSKKYHPDVSREIESERIFADISEAYEILSNLDQKVEYDRKSKFGKNYNEFEEFFKIDLDYSIEESERVFNSVKDKELLDIIVKVNKDDFNGSLEFIRWVMCKKCTGSGKDVSSKIIIKNDKGEIKYFEADEGCDFCDGVGKYLGQDCSYCNGKGKVGINSCSECKGDGRIKGKQKVKDLKIKGDEISVKSMGNWKNGRVGKLVIKLTST